MQCGYGVFRNEKEYPTAVRLHLRLLHDALHFVQAVHRDSSAHHSRLAAPLMATPFTHSEIGVLMRKGQEYDLLLFVNLMIRKMKADGSLERLKVKYGLSGNNTK